MQDKRCGEWSGISVSMFQASTTFTDPNSPDETQREDCCKGRSAQTRLHQFLAKNGGDCFVMGQVFRVA